MNVFQHTRRLLCSCLLLGLTLGSTGIARAQISEEHKSVVAFDIQMQEIRKGDLFQSMSGDEALSRMLNPHDFKGLDLTKTERLIGSIGYPESVEELINAESTRVLPFQFFVRAQLVDANTAKTIYGNFARNSREVIKGGKTYLYSDSQRDPKNVSIRLVKDKGLEVGTDVYSFQPTRNFHTNQLSASWKALPNAPIRIALDAESAEQFIGDLLKFAEREMPPQFATLLSPLSGVASASLAIDIESDQLMRLSATAKDREGAETLQTSLNGLLTLAKASIQPKIAQSPSPEMARAMSQIIESLAIERNETTLSMIVARPEGFNEAMLSAVSKARQAAEKVAALNNMRQVLLAMHNHHAAFRRLPWKPLSDSHDPDLSWRYRLLPFLEEQQMYSVMDREKGPDDAPNRQFANQMPATFGPGGSNSNIQCILHENMPKGLANITDGTSNTIALIRTPSNTPWLKSPGGITIEQAVNVIRSAPDGEPTIVGLYDGSVRKLDNSVDAKKLRAMLTYAGGEKVDF